MLLNGTLQLRDFQDIVERKAVVEIGAERVNAVQRSFRFLEAYARDKVIYGINTGFGPMAQWRIEDAHLHELQYNIIRSHATGAGTPLPDIAVRAALLARLQTFLQGFSGINMQACELLVEFLNHGIYPIVPEHGSVGASGDLVQLAHIALALIGEGEVSYGGVRRHTEEVFRELGLSPLAMYVREGLAVTNGTAVMTGHGLVNLLAANRLLSFALRASVLMNEVAASYDDFLSPSLNAVKRHRGQMYVANAMREIAQGSQRMRNRAAELYHSSETAVFNQKVQPYYSLRCVPQVLGPVLDALLNAEEVLVDELNAVDDNPIVSADDGMVYHGGNFHGDYVSFEMDKVKIAVTKMTMLAERQLNYLLHDRINGILPPFVNMGTLGLNYGMQACQFTATSTTAECQTLSNPMYVHSIPNNNDNQDVVSMGTNSALLCRRVIENSFQVMAVHAMALAQAVDCLKISESLSSTTRSFYEQIRAVAPMFVEDTTHYEQLAALVEFLKNGEIEYEWK